MQHHEGGNLNIMYTFFVILKNYCGLIKSHNFISGIFLVFTQDSSQTDCEW